MMLTPQEIEQAAIRMAKGCMGRKWDDVSAVQRDKYRRAVKNLAAVYEVSKTEQSVEFFMRWVGFDTTSIKPGGGAPHKKAAK